MCDCQVQWAARTFQLPGTGPQIRRALAPAGLDPSLCAAILGICLSSGISSCPEPGPGPGQPKDMRSPPVMGMSPRIMECR